MKEIDLCIISFVKTTPLSTFLVHKVPLESHLTLACNRAKRYTVWIPGVWVWAP